MSNKFNQKLKDAKNQIQEECKLFLINYQNFLPLSHQIISTNGLDDNTIECCKHFLDELNNGNLRLIFCGQVKSGKSRCIIEFLSGKINLPSCETPTTTYFTVIYFEDNPILYSESLQKQITKYDFDGKNVANCLVGRNIDLVINENDLEMIYYVGTPHTYGIKNFYIIDTPGLNETKSISEAFFKNLKKLNPQLIIYLFDSGPGFTTYDHLLCTDVVAHSRKDLKKIFLFNKYDVAFKDEPVFEDEPNDNTSSDGGDVSDEDDDEEDNSESDDEDDESEEKEKEKFLRYETDHEKHLQKLQSYMPEDDKLTLIGYSGKLVQKLRLYKENPLPFLLFKHIDFLNEIQNHFNTINRETIEKTLQFSELYLCTKFKEVHMQILLTSDKDLGRKKLEGEARKQLLDKFDQTHEEINIQPSKMNQVELDSMINEIIDYQVKQMQKTESVNVKLRKIANSLTQFFNNRYFNLFTNVIHTSLDGISFDPLCDEIRNNDLEKYFPHTFCALRHEVDTYNLNWIIENYFQEQTDYLNVLANGTTHNFNTAESYKQFFKTNLKYDLESIIPKIEDYKRIKLDKERKLLANAIEMKIIESENDYRMSEQETEMIIKETVGYFNMWISLNNNYLMALRNSKISDEKRSLLNSIISDEVDLKILNGKSLENSTLIKMELIDFKNISCQNNDIIQYFLRTQTISQHLFKCHLFYHECTKHLYFLTDTHHFKPLRILLPQLISSQKISLIHKLANIVEKLYKNRLPIDNLGTDMIFGVITSDDDVEVKLTETIQLFHQLNYTLNNGNLCDKICFKFPFQSSSLNTMSGHILSMFYSFGWILLIIIHGKCDQLIKYNITKDKYPGEINKLFKDKTNSKVYNLAKSIIEKCLKQRFGNEMLEEILGMVRKLKESPCDF